MGQECMQGDKAMGEKSYTVGGAVCTHIPGAKGYAGNNGFGHIKT